MKKLFSYSIVMLLMVSSLLMGRDQAIPVTSIPKAAKTFLNQYYSGIELVFAEKDKGEVEVTLANGVEVSFLSNGDWKQVDGKYQAIPTGFIPAPVLATIKKMYPSAAIIKIEKDWAGYDIELNNRMELKIAADGQVYEMEHDN